MTASLQFVERFTIRTGNDKLALVDFDRSDFPRERHEALYSREAAQVLGVSYPTLKQWIYKGRIRTVKTPGGHHRIPEKQVDKFLYRASEVGDVRERRMNFRRVAAAAIN